MVEACQTKSWRWFTVRTMGLFACEDSRLRRTLMPDEKPSNNNSKPK